MASIFHLKTSVEELSSANQGTSRMEYDQYPPTRDVTNGNFPNGAIHFRFQTSGQKWWIPSRSYIRTRISIAKANGTQLTKADNIAPNMGLCASLFQNAEFRIQDKTVSRISDFMPQVDALETRLSKSRAHLNGIGNAVNFWNDNFKVRQSDIVADGFYSKDITEANQPTSAPYSRVELGFNAAGGAAADERNSASYAEATGIITFAAGTAAALPADVRTVFPVGSYFQYISIQGGTATDARIKKPARVVAGLSATTIRVETGIIGADVAGDGRTDFVRVDVQPQDAVDSSRKLKYVELIWQPPLSIFKIGHALPSGKFELILNPQTASVYQKNAIQSILANKVSGTDFSVNIEDMYFYCSTVEGPRADDITYLLDLEQTACQSDNVPGIDFAQRNFDVSPSTYALTVAYQDSRVGSDTQFSQSQFKSYGADSSVADEELKLNRFFINYAGQNLPAPKKALGVSMLKALASIECY